jgi:hypothetical protein
VWINHNLFFNIKNDDNDNGIGTCQNCLATKNCFINYLGPTKLEEFISTIAHKEYPIDSLGTMLCSCLCMWVFFLTIYVCESTMMQLASISWWNFLYKMHIHPFHSQFHTFFISQTLHYIQITLLFYKPNNII